MPDVLEGIDKMLLLSARTRCCRGGSPIYFAESESMKQKTETWELVELVMAGCPAEALKSFRKSVIGKGKPLTAREADAAIGGARSALAGFERESMSLWAHRQNWYLSHGMPVIYAGREYVSAPVEVHLMIARRGADVVLLEFDSQGVNRVPLRRSTTDEEAVAG